MYVPSMLLFEMLPVSTELSKRIPFCQSEITLPLMIGVMVPAGLAAGTSPRRIPSAVVEPSPVSWLLSIVTVRDAVPS